MNQKRFNKFFNRIKGELYLIAVASGEEIYTEGVVDHLGQAWVFRYYKHNDTISLTMTEKFV